MLVILSACSRNSAVEDYFKDHGLSYPVDVSRLGVPGIEYVGIGESEMSAEGAGEYVKGGIIFIKEYFRKQDVKEIMPGGAALSLSDPVLFRDESEAVGLMVKVLIFGTGKQESKNRIPIKWLGIGKELWQAENFAYFSPEGYNKWKFKGWVY